MKSVESIKFIQYPEREPKIGEMGKHTFVVGDLS
jgi:hypothetical protein